MSVRFVYHATAAGVGARITRIDPPGKALNPADDNVDYIVPIQGASCLPVFGGLSESRVGSYAFRVEQPRPLTLMSVGSVSTRASSAHPSKRPFRAEVESRVTDLHFIERIVVRHAVARLVSVHDGGTGHGPDVVPEGCELEGLLLDGYPIRVDLDQRPFAAHPTLDGLKANLQSFAAEFGQHLVRALQPENASGDEIVVGTIVRNIDLGTKPPPGVKRGRFKNSILWDGVGEIFLGELLMTRRDRRLTMVRVEFGSPVKGVGGGPEVQGNSGPVQES